MTIINPPRGWRFCCSRKPGSSRRSRTSTLPGTSLPDANQVPNASRATAAAETGSARARHQNGSSAMGSARNR